MTITSLEDFVASFNRYEAENNLFIKCDRQGSPWWDLVRYRVQFALCVEYGFFHRSYARPAQRVVNVRSFARQARRLVHDYAEICKPDTRQVRTLVMSRRSIDFIDGVADTEAERGQRMLFVNKAGEIATPHIAIKSQSIQFITRLAHRTRNLPSEVEKDARWLAQDIRARFESNADIFRVIARKYREELIARRVWSFILDKATGVERLIYVNDDTLKTLVLLARARGIVTEEVQHAYMGRAHIAFSYPPLVGGLVTLPHRVIVTRDTGDITYPVERIVLKTVPKRRDPVPRDIDVLIGSSPSRCMETIDIVATLVGQGLRLAVKLHPAEIEKNSEISMRFTAGEVEIHAGDEDFCDLAWRARLFIPVNPTSTTAFEASEMGARVVLLDPGGVKRTAISDGVTSARAGSLDALPEVVRSEISIIEADAESDTRQKQ